MTKDNINIYFRRVFNPNVKSIEYVQQARTQNECTDFEIFVQKKNGLNLKINGSVLIIRCDIIFKGELLVLKYLTFMYGVIDKHKPLRQNYFVKYYLIIF